MGMAKAMALECHTLQETNKEKLFKNLDILLIQGIFTTIKVGLCLWFSKVFKFCIISPGWSG